MDHRSLIFVYGTLKRNFPNYHLLKTLDTTFVATARTATPYPLVLGPFSIPFLIPIPGSGHRISGELFSVSSDALAWLDDFEGTAEGLYERRSISVVPVVDGGGDGEEVEVEAYFANSSYAEALWRRSDERGMTEYSETDAVEYVEPKDRIEDSTFVEEVYKFVDGARN